MKLYKVSVKAAEYYRQNVKGNSNTDLDTIRKKLTRNIMLADRYPNINRNTRLYRYGNLLILTKRDKAIWLHNVKTYDFEVDRGKYKELNELLGI